MKTRLELQQTKVHHPTTLDYGSSMKVCWCPAFTATWKLDEDLTGQWRSQLKMSLTTDNIHRKLLEIPKDHNRGRWLLEWRTWRNPRLENRGTWLRVSTSHEDKDKGQRTAQEGDGNQCRLVTVGMDRNCRMMRLRVTIAREKFAIMDLSSPEKTRSMVTDEWNLTVVCWLISSHPCYCSYGTAD